MNTRIHHRLIKPLLLTVIVSAIISFLAFTPSNSKISETTLYFKYLPTSDFTSGSVTTNGNWQLVSPSEICEQEADDVACSFSIKVGENEASNYVNSSNNPSSRVSIQANGSGSYFHVDDVMDNVTITPILDSKENVERP